MTNTPSCCLNDPSHPNVGIPDSYCAQFTQANACVKAGMSGSKQCMWFENACGTGPPAGEGFYQSQGVCCNTGGGISNAMYTAKSEADCNSHSGMRWFGGRNTCDRFTVAPSNTIYTSCIL